MSDICGCTGGLLQAEETVADELGVQLDGLLLQALVHVQVGCVQHLHHKIKIKNIKNIPENQCCVTGSGWSLLNWPPRSWSTNLIYVPNSESSLFIKDFKKFKKKVSILSFFQMIYYWYRYLCVEMHSTVRVESWVSDPDPNTDQHGSVLVWVSGSGSGSRRGKINHKNGRKRSFINSKNKQV